MIFDGMRWTRSRKVVSLPQDYWLGESKNYVTFGRVSFENAPGAVKTNWKDESWEPPRDVWATPIPCDGHSLTNLMYGKDGKAYLMLDGLIYVRSFKRRKS